jgi:hypothetical protein
VTKRRPQQPVDQRGAFTGLAIDTYKGRFHMLPEKLASMVSAMEAAAALSTPRIIARVFGKVLHYGCAIPFVAVAAPSLSQLMHNRETDTGPVAVPSLDKEKAAVFDWDRELRVSERARRALEFIRTATENYGHAVPSSLYGAFLASEERDLIRRQRTLQYSRLGGGPAHGPGGLQDSAGWTCWAQRASTQQRSRTVRRRRCTWRRCWLSADPGCRQAVPAR